MGIKAENTDQDDNFELMDSSYDLVTIKGILERANIPVREGTFNREPMLEIGPSFGIRVAVQLYFSADGGLQEIGEL